MPISHKKQLKAAREALSEKQPTLSENSNATGSEDALDLDSLKSSLSEAMQQIQLLEKQLADQVKVCNGLQDNLNESQDFVNMLRTEILSLKAKNSDIYHQLRIERQRYKRVSLKNGTMTSQIALLKKSDAASSKVLKDSACVIEKILKTNEDQTEAIKSKLISSDTRLKNAQKDVSRLRESYHRATQVKNHAVETAKAKVI